MTARKRITIKDVAAETGLALSTVSNALAGKVYVRKETSDIVHEAAKRLGFRASAVARAMRMQRSFTVGVLISDVANPSSADFVRGVEDVSVEEKCSLFLCNTDGDEARQLWHMRALLDRQVDGFVLISQHCSSPEVRELLDGGTPFVLVQRRDLNFSDDYVGCDNVSGLSDALKHLVDLNHRRIGFVRGPVDSSSANERLDTFNRQVKELGLDPDPELVFAGDYSFDAGVAAGDYFLDLPMPPTAVFGSSDINAIGVIDAANARGLDVPNDLSIVGLDDISLASFKGISLTTIHLCKREIGAAAAEILMRKIRGEVGEPETKIFPTSLVVRNSSKTL